MRVVRGKARPPWRRSLGLLLLLGVVPLLRPLLLGALPFGLIVVLAITSEAVELDATGLQRRHPAWCRWWLRNSWELRWDQIQRITPVATSQGGRVFYLGTTAGRSVLLPQRLDRFEDFLTRFQQHTGLDTSRIGRITPAWTYQLLALLSGLMLAAELLGGWAVVTGRWEFPPGLGL